MKRCERMLLLLDAIGSAHSAINIAIDELYAITVFLLLFALDCNSTTLGRALPIGPGLPLYLHRSRGREIGARITRVWSINSRALGHHR